jgi:nicotinamide phosphoribosyltransferase
VRRIKESGGKAIVRPDSGVPWEVAPEVVRRLAVSYGTTTNSKGYDVLHPSIGVIQGDGVNYESIGKVQDAVIDLGLSAENLAFGMGGALLQGPNRDLLGFAEKANANKRNGLWHDQYKIAPGKNSKRGQLALVKRGGKIMTIPKHEAGYGENILRPVFKNGQLLYSYNFEEIRERAHKHFIESFEMQEAA